MDKLSRKLTWDEVCADPSLHDLPYKIELNGYNQIVLVPTSSRHRQLQGEFIRRLTRLLPDGRAFPKLAVDTLDNTKVPDVVWATEATLQAHRHELETSWSAAPELCIEVLSPTNTRTEIAAKCALYFEAGAREVWVCDTDGDMTFHVPDGPLERSVLCPEFPARVEV